MADRPIGATLLISMNISSGQLNVLDAGGRFNPPVASSPDGRTIAYEAGGPQLYQGSMGSQLFDAEQYGVQGIQGIGSPAWSSDGKRLAWYVGGDFGQGQQVGIAVFDLTAHTGRLFHPYTNLGRGGWFTAPSWSPNGQWLAFDNEDEDPLKAGVWIVRVDGREEHHPPTFIGAVMRSQVWRPDSHWLVSGTTLVEVGTWHSQQIALPQGAEVIGWVTLSE